MNIRLFIIGLLFFINPCIEVIDVLPDFIGAIFILAAINKLSHIDEKAGFARQAMLIFMWVNIVKCLSIVVLPLINENNMAWMLVLTFVFGLIETGLLIYFFEMLEKSLSYSGMIKDATKVYENSRSFTLLSVVFVTVRAIMSMLPELVYLNTDYGYVTNYTVNWDFVTYILMGVNIVVTLALGIVWYLNSIKYLKGVRSETKYLSLIDDEYEKNYASDIPLVTYRAFRTFSLLIILSSVFLVCIRLDGIDALPDFVAAAFLIAASVRIKGVMKKKALPMFISSIVLFVFSAVDWTLWYLFSTDFYSNKEASISFIGQLEIYRGLSPEIDNNFRLLCISGLIKALLTVLCLVTFLGLLRYVIGEHTGAIPELHSEITEKKTKKIRKRLSALTAAFFSVFCINTILDPVSTFFCIDIPDLTPAAITFGAFSLILTFVTFTKLTEAIENRYMY